MQIKKSQRRSRKAGRKACHSRKACRSRKSCRKARRSMHGGILPPPLLPLPPRVVVTVHNQNPPSYKIGSFMRIEEPDVSSAFIASLNDKSKRGLADAFAKGRGTTREQLINDLRSGKLLLHPLDYYKVNYVIIRETDPRPSLHSSPEPFLVPAYVPPPSALAYVHTPAPAYVHTPVPDYRP